MGFSGALTTWSTFVLDLSENIQVKNRFGAMLNLFCNYIFAIVAAWLGIMIASG
jgi:fluoride ion exporter CrcB/FEX